MARMTTAIVATPSGNGPFPGIVVAFHKDGIDDFTRWVVDDLEEAAKANVTIHPMSGEDTRAAYRAFYAQPKAVIARAKKIMGRSGE